MIKRYGRMSYACKKHKHMGTSSSHNEYMALSHATKAVVWLRQLLQEMELGDMIKEPTPMLGDNDQATLISQEDIVTSGNKFYLLDYHYAKEAQKNGHTSTRRIDTLNNLSDVFTKALGPADLERLTPRLTGNGNILPPAPPRRAD